jgi:hypothetical protein
VALSGLFSLIRQSASRFRTESGSSLCNRAGGQGTDSSSGAKSVSAYRPFRPHVIGRPSKRRGKPILKRCYGA